MSKRENGLPPVDDEWWRDVKYDWRTRVPDIHYIEENHPQANYRLDRQNAFFEIACPCGRTALLNRETMIRQVGNSINVLYLVREWMPCRERNKMANNCRAYVVR